MLALDGQWQALDHIRILMGAETTYRTRTALLDAVRARAVQILDESLEVNKGTNPFLHGVPAILDALRSGQIECRVYDQGQVPREGVTFTHAKLEVVGSQALVGSSNFTAPWPDEEHRAQYPGPERTRGCPASGMVRDALERGGRGHQRGHRDHRRATRTAIRRSMLYAKALQEYFRGHELTATEWDENRSKMFPRIDRYQKEAYRALMKIARQHGGAFLCDGVGLGKTFVGMMLIERLVLHEGKRVVLFAPKATKEGVWEPHLREWLPHIGGVGGNADFSNLAVLQPHGPRPQGRLPGAIPAHRRACGHRGDRRSAPLPQPRDTGQR